MISGTANTAMGNGSVSIGEKAGYKQTGSKKEGYMKSSPQPCMKYGEQMKHDFLGTPRRNEQDRYPSTGPAQQEHPNGNESLMVKSKGSGLIGDIKCKGKEKFGTEMAATFAVGGSAGDNTSTRYMGKKGY